MATLNSGGNDGGFRTEPGEHMVIDETAHTLRSNERNTSQGKGNYVAHTLNANYGRTTDAAGSRGTGPKNLVTHALTSEGSDASEDGTGRGTPIIAATLSSGSHPNSNEPGRRREDDENLAVSSSAVRRLTPKECERLQGFPADFTQGESDSARYRMLGNAVCVNVARWIGERIR